MGAEHVPQPFVSALADQMQIDLAERRQEAVRVVDDETRVAVGDLEPVVAYLLAFQHRLEHAARMDLLGVGPLVAA